MKIEIEIREKEMGNGKGEKLRQNKKVKERKTED